VLADQMSVKVRVYGRFAAPITIQPVRKARYGFTKRWILDAPPSMVFDVLKRVDDYPKWWPDFVSVNSAGPNSYDMVVKGFLPYKIKYRLMNNVIDRKNLVLEGVVDGDLEGWIRWDVNPRNPVGCDVLFKEEVSTKKWILNTFSSVLRPIFRFNHKRVMNRGEYSIRALLGGFTLAKSDPNAFDPTPS